MAKRKRAAVSTLSRKRAKGGTHPHGDFDTDKEYKVRTIIGESKTKYHIRWEDDEETGEQYEDTWEPKSFVNREAVNDWKAQKAAKKRIAGQSGPAAVRSASSSVVSTPAPASPRKPATPTERRGRPRKVVESSPPSTARVQTNGKQAIPTAQEVLEISESEQSDLSDPPEDLDDSTAASPLFVSQDRVEVSADVQPSQPPSSYFAGAYEPVSSSQPPQSSAPVPEVHTQAEPSQFIPDPADTSSTTNETTEVSVVPTTPSQQVASVPVDVGDTSKLVADSQSVPGSASYNPPADTTTSHSDSALQTSTDISNEIPANSTEDHVSSQIGAQSPEPGVEIQASIQAAADVTGDQHSRDSTEVSPDPARRRSGSEDPAGEANSSGVESAPLVESQTLDGAAETVTGDAQSQPQQRSQAKGSQSVEASSPAKVTEFAESAVAQSSTFEPTSAQPPQTDRPTTSSTVSQSEERPHTGNSDSSILSEERDRESQAVAGAQSIQPPTHRDRISYSPSKDGFSLPPPSTKNNRINLASTAQKPQASHSRFAVTPPDRHAIAAVQSYPQPLPPHSSDWQSSFPFETQLPRSSEAIRQSQRIEYTPIRNSSPSVPRGDSRQIANSAPPVSSSPIPNPPSQSLGIGIFGESAPSRPLTPSSPRRIMDNSQSTPSSSLSARLKAIREKQNCGMPSSREVPTSVPATDGVVSTQNSEAQLPPTSPEGPAVTVTASEPASAIPPRLASPVLFTQDGWRSPSAVPHLEPLPVITQEEMTTSGRYETLLPQTQDYNDERERNGSLTLAGTPSRDHDGTNPETANLHTIPIAMHGMQRDQYVSTVFYYRDAIQRFLDTPAPDDALTHKINVFAERMRHIAMHIDLDNSETLTQYDVDPVHQADWDVKCSAKFRFLNDLFRSLREDSVTVAIVTQPGRVTDMLETFFKGRKIACRRLGVDPAREAERAGNAKALLLDTNVEVNESENVDLVLAMENLVRHDTASMRALRRTGNKWTPFVSLVVPRTVEHIERCLPPDLPELTASKALVGGIFQLRNDAGRLEDGQQPPGQAAIELARYLRRGDWSSPWPIASLSLLPDLASQVDSEPEVVASASAHAGAKRSREPDESVSGTAKSHKRARIGTQGTVKEGEVTHISDSIGKTIQSNDTSEQSIQMTPIEKRLQSLLVEAQDRLAEHKAALGDLQYRHEEQRNQLFERTKERDSAIETAQSAVIRFQEQSNKMSTLRTRNTELEEELKQANERLLNHTIPEKAEFEALRLAAVEAKAASEKTENKLQIAQRDLDYIRGLYQNSSNSAQDLAAQNTELENQVAALRNKATGEQAKLRQMGFDAFTKNLREENKKLKALLKDGDAGIKFRDEEIAKLNQASRGRMGTRGTSVPRTPRVGSPMKMDKRMGSRQTSPAAGEMREKAAGLLHPLRNAQG